MYGDMSKIEEMKRKTDEVSPTLCLAKWMQVTIHLLSGQTHSCYLPPSHHIPIDEIEDDPSALHNTKYKKSIRKMMLEGVRPKECSICWKIEDLPNNQLSDRQLRSVDDWAFPYLDKIKNMDWQENINPTYVEIVMTDTCNLKCSYCAPSSSSLWATEISRSGPYKLSNGQELHQFNWLQAKKEKFISGDTAQYINAFWKWWPSLSKDLKHFRITGGEPLLSSETFKILDDIETNSYPKLHLSINSNLCVSDKVFDKFLEKIHSITSQKKVKHFMIHASIDTWGEQAEYIRDGLNFKQFIKNVNRYLNEVPHSTLALMCTFNILSIPNFDQFLNWVIALRRIFNSSGGRILLDVPHLVGPTHQCVKILPNEYLDKMNGLIQQMVDWNKSLSSWEKSLEFRQAEIEKMQRILSWMSEPSEKEWLKTNRANFYLFFKEYDKRRNKDFLKSFPEMNDFWEICKKASITS